MAYKTLLKKWWVRMKTKQKELPTHEAGGEKKRQGRKEGKIERRERKEGREGGKTERKKKGERAKEKE